ncbi:MAG: WD40 repeat domain-containing protein [Anaerolineae bacterium]|nr:WD40 repeat domain-containing protein [Anaerolineae bacterium]
MKPMLWAWLGVVLLLVGCVSREDNAMPRGPLAITYRVPAVPIAPQNAPQIRLSGFLQGHSGTVFQVAFSADSQRYLTIGGDQRLIVWDMTSGEPLLQLERRAVQRAFFLPTEEAILTLDTENHVRKWSLETATEAVAPVFLQSNYRSAALSPDGSHLAVGLENGVVRLFDTESLGLAAEVLAYTGGYPVLDLQFAPDGGALYTLAELGVAHWTLAEDAATTPVADRQEAPLGWASTPDHRWWAIVYANEVLVLDLLSGTERNRFNLPITPGQPLALELSVDGNWLALGTGRLEAVLVFDVASGSVVASLGGHEQAFRSLVLSPDRALLLTGLDRRSPFLWNLSSIAAGAALADESQVPRAALNLVPDLHLHALDWSPDGRYVVLRDERGPLYVLGIPQ